MRKLKFLRVLFAVLSFIALTACFLDFTGTASDFLGWTVKLQFWPGVLALSVSTIVTVLACTLLFGRVYCSVMCPLGIFQDVLIFFRRLLGFKFPASGETKPARLVREGIRFACLAVFLAGGFLWLHFRWMEPYAIYGRAVSALLSPVWRMGNNVLAQQAERHASYAFHAVEVVTPPLAVVVISAGMLALVAAFALWKGRIWCNAFCPVGTMLGNVARFSAVKIRIDAKKCVKCGQCARVCKAGCIDVSAGKIDPLKCVACFDCGPVCGKGAIAWSK